MSILHTVNKSPFERGSLDTCLKFASHSMKWKDRDPENAALESIDYEATLKTGGLQLQLGAQVKF